MTHRDISISISIFAYICSPNRRGLCVRRKFTSHMWWPGGAARICIRLLHISWGNFNKLRVGLFFLIKIWRKTCTWSFYTQKWSFPGYEVPKMDLHVHMNIFVHISSYGNKRFPYEETSYFFFIFFLHIFFIYFLHIFSSYALHMSTSYLYEHYVQHFLQ